MAMLCIARTMLSPDGCSSVCLSVCLSVTRRYCTSKWLNISLYFFHRRVATPYFFIPNIMAILRRRPHNGDVECRGYEKSRDFRPISHFISEMIRDTYSHSYYGMRRGNRTLLSSGTIFTDFERPLTQISRWRHYMTLNISETVRDTDIVTIKY